VPHVRDFLSRFRPAGAPGPGRAAVPADRRRELESELGPVLALLDEPSAECADILSAAQRDAERIVSTARAEAQGLTSAARERAADHAAELVRQAVAAARTEAAAIVAAGEAEAASITERSRERVPALAGRAVALIRELGQDDGTATPGPAGPAPSAEPGRPS